MISKVAPVFDYNKIVHWGKLVSITGGAQILVQLSSFISGIIIIRFLSTKEYALYTLANTMLGTMAILADSGIINGVMAESGKVWQNENELGIVLATGWDLRKRFGVISSIVSIPVLAYLLLTHGANWYSTIMILFATIFTFSATLSDSLLEIVPKIHQDIKPLQKNQIEVGLGRLVLTCIAIVIFPYTFIALITNGLPRIYGNYRLKIITNKFISSSTDIDVSVKRSIYKGVRRSLPIAIYHCISGQLSIWLVSFFGNTTSISQIGALGRLSIAFSIFITLFSTLIIPRFSRMPYNRSNLLKYFLLSQLSALLISMVLLSLIWIFSSDILWILGHKYKFLKNELLLVAIFNCVNLISSVCSQLISSRGWFLKPYFIIGINFISTVLSIAFFNISSLAGVLEFTIFVYVIVYIAQFIYGILSINKINIGL